MKYGQDWPYFQSCQFFQSVKFQFLASKLSESDQFSNIFLPQIGQSGNPGTVGHELFLTIGRAPLGALPLGPVLGTLVMAPTKDFFSLGPGL